MASLQKRLIFKKYKVGKLIDKTQNSSIYEGINKKTKEPVAVKFEKIGNKYDSIESEVYILLLLKGKGIPNVISYGKVMNYKVLIEELLGHSIFFLWRELIIKKDKSNDICLIAIQCLDRLEYIHSKNIIHKDIKPANFIIGRKDPQLIYLIDFGISRKYKSSRTGKHIKFQKVEKINGSLRYMSINACKGYEHSRRDDLESLGYMLIYLMKNNLPWAYVEDENISPRAKLKKICSLKISTTLQELCKDLPNEFYNYIDYCRNLDYEQEPDYNYLRNLFINVLIKKEKMYGLNPLDCKSFSWLKKSRSKIIKKDILSSSQISPRNTYINKGNKGKNNAHKRIYCFLKNSVEKKSQESLNLTESKRLNSDFKKITINLNKSIDDNYDKNVNSENVISINNDSSIVKKINTNIANNIKRNKKEIFDQKNVKVKKIRLKDYIKNMPKLNNKINYSKISIKKQISLDLHDKPQNDKKSYIKTDDNLKLIKDNFKKKIIKNSKANIIQKRNINYSLQNYQYRNESNLAKSTNFDFNTIANYLNNKNHIKNSSLNNEININYNLSNNIHYKSIIKSERKKENPKKKNYMSESTLLNNNFKIEYNFNNSNNFYFNNDLISNSNNYIFVNRSNDIIDQANQLYNTTINDEFENYKNNI